MPFSIQIDQFEGPLDLMLHLVKENKLDLFDLDMDILTQQYLEYINAMEEMHLEIASEFLSELAGLLEYKSKKLLPREKVLIEEEYEEDHKEKLAARLLEYRRYQEVCERFHDLYEQRQLSYTKPLSDETQQWTQKVSDEKIKGNPNDLVRAMNKVLRRLVLLHPREMRMHVNELSLDERLLQIKTRLMDFVGKLSFEELCNDCDSLHMVIVTFLAVLDLVKHGEISYAVDQHDIIWIVKGVEA